MHRFVSISILLLYCLFALVTLQAQTAEAPKNQSVATNFVLGSGDLVEITVFEVPELTQTRRVTQDGKLDVTLLGSLSVSGVEPAQLQQTIAVRLKEGNFVANPQVTVLVKEYASQGIAVFGEVRKPGVYQVLAPRPLIDLLSQAGGLDNAADPRVRIRRARTDNEFIVNISAKNAQQSLDNNVQIFPGDTVIVPKAGVAYVLGDVFRPGGFVMENEGRMSVLQAIAMANGVNHTAAADKARIIRRTENGFQETQVPLGSILKGKVPDQWLQPDDVLVVPSSAAKVFARRSLDAIFSTASSLTVYSLRRY